MDADIVDNRDKYGGVSKHEMESRVGGFSNSSKYSGFGSDSYKSGKLVINDRQLQPQVWYFSRFSK